MRHITLEVVKAWLLANTDRARQMTAFELRSHLIEVTGCNVSYAVLYEALRDLGMRRSRPTCLTIDGVPHYDTATAASMLHYSENVLIHGRLIGKLQAHRVRGALYWDLDHVRSVLER